MIILVGKYGAIHRELKESVNKTAQLFKNFVVFLHVRIFIEGYLPRQCTMYNIQYYQYKTVCSVFFVLISYFVFIVLARKDGVSFFK